MNNQALLREIAKQDSIRRDDFIELVGDKKTAVAVYRWFKENGWLSPVGLTEENELPAFICITEGGKKLAENNKA